MDEQIDYRGSGVDIGAGEDAVERIKGLAQSTFRKGVLQGLGGFGGLFALDGGAYRKPVLVAGCDGVGTKLKIAFALGKHDSIGEDCVAMCANDILVQGAEVLFFLDYIALGKLDPGVVEQVVTGLARGCRLAGCALLGGETAEMPGFYPPGEYELAGFAVGAVEQDGIIDGRGIAPGDAVIGLASTGLHSNGYALARKVLLEQAGLSLEESPPELGGATLGEEMLRPTHIYVPDVLPLLQRFRIKGMAHITGGGLPGNVPRILPPGLRAVIDGSSWSTPPIFGLIEELGPVAPPEMFRTFNMGIGYILVTPPEEAAAIIKFLEDKGLSASLIGLIAPRESDAVGPIQINP